MGELEMAGFLGQLGDRFTLVGDSALDLTLSLLLASIMAWLISVLYKRTHRGLNYEHSFISTLVLISPIVTTVMFFIQGDLVLSLGLVGSLSIIRFRTPIKDTRDMIFLFWSIAVGLGAGTFNWLAVGVATLFIGIVVSALFLLEHDRVQHSDYVLVVSGTEPSDISGVKDAIRNSSRSYRVRSRESQGESWEMVAELSFVSPADAKIDTMLAHIRGLEGVDRVSLLAPQLALPM
jgi:hypothetical protein